MIILTKNWQARWLVWIETNVETGKIVEQKRAHQFLISSCDYTVEVFKILDSSVGLHPTVLIKISCSMLIFENAICVVEKFHGIMPNITSLICK